MENKVIFICVWQTNLNQWTTKIKIDKSTHSIHLLIQTVLSYYKQKTLKHKINWIN